MTAAPRAISPRSSRSPAFR